HGKLTPPLQSGGWAIFSGNGASTTTIATSQNLSDAFSEVNPSFPASNAGGTVVFRGTRRATTTPPDPARSGIFTGSSGPTSSVADNQTAPFSTDYLFGNAPDINDAGTAV